MAGMCDDLREFKDEGTELNEAKLAENIEELGDDGDRPVARY
jgi:hypothetical protein